MGLKGLMVALVSLVLGGGGVGGGGGGGGGGGLEDEVTGQT